jgi:hypothetical protein
MANTLSDYFKEEMLAGTHDLIADTVKNVLIDTGTDSLNLTVDDFYDDLNSAAIPTSNGTGTLASKSNTSPGNGAFDSADPVMSACSDGTSRNFEHMGLYVDTAGAASTDPWVANYDTFTSGMPVTPNSGDVTTQVHANGWFTL